MHNNLYFDEIFEYIFEKHYNTELLILTMKPIANIISFTVKKSSGQSNCNCGQRIYIYGTITPPR